MHVRPLLYDGTVALCLASAISAHAGTERVPSARSLPQTPRVMGMSTTEATGAVTMPLKRRRLPTVNGIADESRLLFRRGGGRPEEESAKSRPESTAQSASSFTSSASSELLELQELQTRPWQTAFHGGARGQPELPSRQPSPDKISTLKLSLSTTRREENPELPSRVSQLDLKAGEGQRKAQEPPHQALAQAHRDEWMEATSRNAWHRMKSANPKSRMTYEEFHRAMRSRADKLGVIREAHALTEHGVQKMTARINELPGSPHGTQRYIRDGLHHYLESVRSDVQRAPSEAPNLEALLKHNEETGKSFSTRGPIR